MRRRYRAGLAAATVFSLVPWGAASASAHLGPRVSQRTAAGIITTIAGGVGGPGRATKIALSPCGAASARGQLYLAEGSAVRRVSEATDRLTTPAGTGSAGPLGDGGPATKASAGGCGVALDHAGNLVISGSGRIRLVAVSTGTFYGQAMTGGDIYTVAGGGGDDRGNGIPAIDASLDSGEVAVDAAGNLLVADTNNGRVRAVAVTNGTFYGQAMAAGDIYTVAGGGAPKGLGDGGPATKARIREPQGVAVDRAGNLLITDARSRIRAVAVKDGRFYGQAMTANDIYTVVGSGNRGFSGDGGRATKAQINLPEAVASDRAGNMLIADTGNNRVRVVAVRTGRFYGRAMTANHIYTIAGNGKTGFSGAGRPATKASVGQPRGVTVDGLGNLVITASGRALVVAARARRSYSRTMTAGRIYPVAGNGRLEFSGDGGLATRAQFTDPWAVAADRAGNVLIADQSGDRVRAKAARSGRLYGRRMIAGHIYTVAGNGRFGFTGDGGPASKARLDSPVGIALDAAGNVLIPDNANNRVRVVAAKTGRFYGRAMTTGHIYTVAGNGKPGSTGDGRPARKASISLPLGITVDHAGNLVITTANRVRVVAARTGRFYGLAMTAGDIYRVAGNGKQGSGGDGGPARQAKLGHPWGVAVDGTGNLVVVAGARVRVVAVKTGTFYGQAMTAGDIYRVAGGGQDLADGIPATSAWLGSPTTIAVDGAGNLIIAAIPNRIRVVAAHSGTFYGQAMTAGDIYTVAGNGDEGLQGGGGFSGDGGPATAAELSGPIGVAVDGAGDLLIADSGNGRIRMVSA